MMDLETVIADLSGAPVMDMQGLHADIKAKPLTVKTVLQRALVGVVEERNVEGDEKVRRALLALRIGRGPTDLKAEEIALCKKLVGKGYDPLTVMRVWEVIDPASVK